jgi:3-phenylpropionate/trans-cinnamate dioxygenase ferredoxin reductase subunit
VNLQILGDIPMDAELAVRGSVQQKSATLFYLQDGSLRGAIAINTPRDLKIARKWMNQGRAVDLATLTDAGKALA